MVAVASHESLTGFDDIPMPTPSFEMYHADSASRELEDSDQLESTVFEMETSLGLSPAETYLPEDELIGKEDTYTTVGDPVFDESEEKTGATAGFEDVTGDIETLEPLESIEDDLDAESHSAAYPLDDPQPYQPGEAQPETLITESSNTADSIDKTAVTNEEDSLTSAAVENEIASRAPETDALSESEVASESWTAVDKPSDEIVAVTPGMALTAEAAENLATEATFDVAPPLNGNQDNVSTETDAFESPGNDIPDPAAVAPENEIDEEAGDAVVDLDAANGEAGDAPTGHRQDPEPPVDETNEKQVDSDADLEVTDGDNTDSEYAADLDREAPVVKDDQLSEPVLDSATETIAADDELDEEIVDLDTSTANDDQIPDASSDAAAADVVDNAAGEEIIDLETSTTKYDEKSDAVNDAVDTDAADDEAEAEVIDLETSVDKDDEIPDGVKDAAAADPVDGEAEEEIIELETSAAIDDELSDAVADASAKADVTQSDPDEAVVDLEMPYDDDKATEPVVDAAVSDVKDDEDEAIIDLESPLDGDEELPGPLVDAIAAVDSTKDEPDEVIIDLETPVDQKDSLKPAVLPQKDFQSETTDALQQRDTSQQMLQDEAIDVKAESTQVKTAVEKANGMGIEPPAPKPIGDMSYLEDTIHELETIVVAEVGSEAASDVDTSEDKGGDDPQDQVNRFLKLGNDAYRQSKYLQAIDYFSKAVDLAPETPVGYLNLAVLAYRLKDFEASADHAKRAIGLGSQSAVKILEKAESKMMLEKPPGRGVVDKTPAQFQNEAVAEPQKTAEAETESAAERDIANEYFDLGLAATEKKKFTEAFDHFKKAVELAPDIPAGYLNLAVISYRHKEYQNAASYAEKALAKGARSAQKILDKAKSKLAIMDDALKYKNDIPDAEVMDDSISLPRMPGEATSDKASESVESTSALKTPPEQDDIARQTPEETIPEEAASPDRETDLIEEPVAEKTEAAKEENGDSPAVDDTSVDVPKSEIDKDAAGRYFARGLEATDKKNYSEAVEHFKKVVELSPDSPAGHLNLAVLAYRRKDYKQSRTYAQQALKLGSHSAQNILNKATQKLALAAKASKDDSNGIQKPADETRTEKKPRPEKEDALAARSYQDADQPADGLKVEEEEIVFDKQTPTGSVDLIETPVGTKIEPGSQELRRQPRLETQTKEDTSFSEKDLANEYFRLGTEAAEQKSFQKAIKYFTKVTEIVPSARRSYIKLAVLFYQTKDFRSAKEFAQTAVNLGSKSALKILEKSETKLRAIQKKKMDASKVQSHAKQIKPQSSKPDQQQQSIRLEDPPQESPPVEDQDKPASPVTERAPKTAREAKTDPDAKATRLRAPKTDEPVRKTDDSGIEKNYTVNEYFAMGLAASERQDFQQAIDYFTKVTELLPNASPSFLNLANLHLNLKDYDTARKHAQRALDLGSKSAQRILDDVEALSK